MSNQPSNASSQLCWICRNYNGGCSWSADFTPVAGWSADAVPPNSQHPDGTYAIYDCPEFDDDRADYS